MAVALADQPERPRLLLGGFSAIAESLWMGAPQASDVVEVVNLARRGWQAVAPRMTRARLAALLTGELTVAEASLVLMASFFVSALLGAVRQVLFNAQFGAGSEASAFYAAIRLPDVLFSLVAGGALSSAMIPVLLATTRDKGERAAAGLAGLVLNALLAAFAALVVAGELLAPAFVSGLLAPGFDAGTSALTVSLTRVLLLQPLILAVGSVATAVLNSRNRFGLTAVSVASHNLGLIAGLVASRLDPALGVAGPALGVIAGAVLQVVVLLPGLLDHGLRFTPRLDLRDRGVREVITLVVPNGLAVGVAYCGFIVDTAFASRSQPGALPALQNAFMLIGLPIALIGQAVGQSAFPRLAADAAAQRWSQLRRTVVRTAGAVVALAVPASVALLLLGRVVIAILFEHGRYSHAAGQLTYDVLFVYTLGLPAYVVSEVVVRSLIALRDTRTPLFTNTFQVAARALLMAVLVGAHGVVAIPIAFAVAATLEVLVLGAVLSVKLARRVGPAEAAA